MNSELFCWWSPNNIYHWLRSYFFSWLNTWKVHTVFVITNGPYTACESLPMLGCAGWFIYKYVCCHTQKVRYFLYFSAKLKLFVSTYDFVTGTRKKYKIILLACYNCCWSQQDLNILIAANQNYLIQQLTILVLQHDWRDHRQTQESFICNNIVLWLVAPVEFVAVLI